MMSYLLEFQRWHCLLGISLVLALSWIISSRRSAIRLRTVMGGLLLLCLLGMFMLHMNIGQYIIARIGDGVDYLNRAADVGIQFVLGDLAAPTGPVGFIFAFRVLPMIVFFGALMQFLYYIGVIPAGVRAINRVVRPLLGTAGSETACVIANSVLGQTEAPLLVRNYLAQMTPSELFLVMTAGMGTLSGAIIAVYAAMGIPVAHLLASSVMAIPASIIIAKLMQPEDQPRDAARGEELTPLPGQDSLLGALGQGTMDGVQLAVAVGAILISYIGLMALLDMILSGISTYVQMLITWLAMPVQFPHLSLSWFFELFGAPFTWLLGLSGSDAATGAHVWGMRIAANEMVAYRALTAASVSPRALMLLTYALCGFANISSIGIQIGSIGTLAPSQRPTLIQLGFRAMIAGVLANMLTACVVGLIV
jgi:CNT family concentrative nucleoside transporter